MKAYELERKNTGDYSWEYHVILAKDEKDMEKVAKENDIDLKDFNIREESKSCLVHTNIY
jgi:hypothetical protein